MTLSVQIASILPALPVHNAPIRALGEPSQVTVSNNLDSSLFENFFSEDDLNSLRILINIQALSKGRMPCNNTMTKDLILDCCIDFLSLNKIKLHIIYQDKIEGEVRVKGVKDIELLRNFLKKLVLILASFPTKFLKSLQIECFTVCEDIFIQGDKLPLKIKEAFNRGFFVLKEHYQNQFDIEHHIYKIIFYQTIRKLPQIIYDWRNIDSEKTDNWNGFPIKKEDAEQFYCFVKEVGPMDDISLLKREKLKNALSTLA